MNQKFKTVVLTGGGTVGHVMLNKLIIPEFKSYQLEPIYIGSKKGIEKDIISETDIEYYSISSGKLRRYLSFENVLDIFKVLKGILDARRRLKKVKPEFVFSKGGFVSVPVVIAARSLKIPVFIHESDLSPGLANKLASKFATKIFVTFRKTLEALPESKAEYIGPIIREELQAKPTQKGFKLTQFSEDKQVLLVMGGSLGAQSINTFIREHLDEITKLYQVIHLCGKGNLDHSIENPQYKQFEFVTKELPDLFGISDIVVGRSGSNAIFEFLLNKKPMLLIPLPKSQSRGDQIENAYYFKSQKYAEVLEEEDLNINDFKQLLNKLENNRTDIVKRMQQFNGGFKPDELVQKLIQLGAKR